MPTKRYLVCGQLENISREVLQDYQAIIRRYVRRRQGVYALYRRGKLYYVGLAINLRSRLAHHLKDKHGDSWDRFSVYLTIGDNHIRELEALILRIVKPCGNRQIARLPRCEDLLPKLRREIRAKQINDLGELMGKAAKKVPKQAKTNQVQVSTSGRPPVLAGYIEDPLRLRAKHRGVLLRAQVRRDGRIRFAGKLYDSPSVAGAAACQRKSCNGWIFWHYERAPGDWVRLDELRR